MNNIGPHTMAGSKMMKNLDMDNYYLATTKNMLESLKMIWFMEKVNFTKWMEQSSKDCGKIIN